MSKYLDIGYYIKLKCTSISKCLNFDIELLRYRERCSIIGSYNFFNIGVHKFREVHTLRYRSALILTHDIEVESFDIEETSISKYCDIEVKLRYGMARVQMHQDLKLLQTWDVRVGAGGGSADPARTSTEGAAPTTPPGGVIEPRATMEHGRVSRAALRAWPATVARKCGPAGPSRGRGPAWADNETSWAVPPKDVAEDEPDVLY
jgi:hypothetical protein